MDVPHTKSSSAAITEHAAPAPQRKRRWENLLNSPLLLVALILATAGLAFKWHSMEVSLKAARVAPVLPDWSWTVHPNTLLIFYPHTDCGCGPGLSTVLTQASPKLHDIAIVSDVQSRKLMAQEANYYHCHLLAPITPETMAHWCRHGNTTILHVRQGQVVEKVEGTTVPNAFFDK